MKKTYFFLLLVVNHLICIGQQSDRDSINAIKERITYTYIKADTTRAKEVSRLGFYYARVDIDSALIYFKEAIDLSDSLNFPFGRMITTQRLGAAYRSKGELDLSISTYIKAFEMSLNYEDNFRAMLVLVELINAAQDKGDFNLAKKYYEIGYKLAPKAEPYTDWFIGRLDLSKGSLFRDNVDFDSAFVYWKKALNTMTKFNLPGAMATINNTMASTYFSIYDYPKALDAHKKALELSKSIDFRPVELDSEIGIARVYAAIDNADLAIERLLPVYREETKRGDPARMMTVEIELISAYTQKKDSDKALEIATKAFNRNKALNVRSANTSRISHILAKLWFNKNKIDSSLFYLDISDSLSSIYNQPTIKFENLILHAKHENLSNDYKAGYKYVVRADSLSKAVLGPQQQAEVSYMTYLYEKEIGSLSKALNALEKSNRLKDSLRNLEKRGDLIRLGSEIETAEKEKEIKERESEIDSLILDIEEKRARNTRSVILFFLVTLIALFITAFRVRKLKTSRKLKEQESEKLQDELIQKNRQLTSNALQDARKNQVLESLLTETKNLQTEQNTDLSKLIRLVKQGINSDKNLELFTLQFEETHPEFFKNLRQKHPDLSLRERQISALLNLNFTTKEIATFLGIEVGSAATARYRLRQKLGLEKDQNLGKYLQSLNNL